MKLLRMYTANIKVKFFGDYALFTRPEGKVERVSYPIMTPSAARGALEAILWKPEFHYRIRSITALKKPKFYSIVRNEVAQKANISKKFMEKPENKYTGDMRQLRHSLVLKDVAYLVEATIVVQSDSPKGIIKYEQMFKRRLVKGQCFYQPYLGTREFSASFKGVTGDEKPIDWTDSLGTMFFDFKYSEKGSVTIPYFFTAQVEQGVMEIPNYLYEEVLR